MTKEDKAEKHNNNKKAICFHDISRKPCVFVVVGKSLGSNLLSTHMFPMLCFVEDNVCRIHLNRECVERNDMSNGVEDCLQKQFWQTLSNGKKYKDSILSSFVQTITILSKMTVIPRS